MEIGIIEDIIKESDRHIKGAVKRTPKTNSLIKGSVNLLFLFHYNDSTNVEQTI